MKIQTAAKTALGAAAVGFTFTTISIVSFLIPLVNAGAPWPQVLLVFFANLKWLHIGFVLFFSFLLLRPETPGKGVWALGISALVQLAFSCWSVHLFFSDPEWHELLGVNIYIVLVELLAPLSVLAFSVLFRKRPPGLGLRLLALFTALALLLNIVYQVLFFGQFDVFSIFDAVATAFVAQWFWLLFLEWRKAILLKEF